MKRPRFLKCRKQKYGPSPLAKYAAIINAYIIARRLWYGYRPIPKFKSGTSRQTDHFAVVGERGREVINYKGRFVPIPIPVADIAFVNDLPAQVNEIASAFGILSEIIKALNKKTEVDEEAPNR